jgi:cell division protein FtsQ
MKGTDPLRRRGASVTFRRAFVRGFAAVVLLAGLLAGGWLLVRDSGLARVTAVHVTGATTSEEGAVRAALEDAAREMTTLHVREDALHDAVAPYASVAGLRVRTDFPHGLSVQVLEHRPVAVLEVDGRRTPVSGGGIVLTGVRPDRGLPTVRRHRPPGERIDDPRTEAALAVAAAAPHQLLDRSERLRWGPEGLTVDLRDGPPLYFGTRDDAPAKWEAAARVLAEPDAAGATYLDLRVPGRVAAGGLGPVAQEDPAANPQP